MRLDSFILLLGPFLLFFSCTENAPSSEPKTPLPAPTTKAIPPKADATKVVTLPASLPPTQRRESGKLHPVDEGQLSPDFLRFRNELLAALDRKDVQFVQQAIAPGIKNSFGGNDGVEEFLEFWNLDTTPQDSELWQTLRKVLLLGGVFDRNNKNAFNAPYLSATWPEKIESFDYVVITGENVRVRRAAGTSGAVVATLSYDVVQLGAQNGGENPEEINGETWPWVKIILPDNSQGYVYGKYVHGPIDYRAYFERKNGRWQMTYFLSGD